MYDPYLYCNIDKKTKYIVKHFIFFLLYKNKRL